MESTIDKTFAVGRETTSAEKFLNIAQSFVPQVLDVCILTFFAVGTIRSFAFAKHPVAEVALDYINYESLPDQKMVSENYLKGPIPKDRVKLADYFTPQNLGNPLVKQEQVLLETAGCDTKNGSYFALPFPEAGAEAQGLFFFFVNKESEAQQVEKNLDRICSEIKNYLNV
jgi:hypothetical protein